MGAKSVTVGDLMTAPAVTVRPHQSLPLAERLMRDERVRHLPVLDGGGRPVGVLSQRDLLAARLGGLHGFDEETRTDLELSVPVGDLMTPAPWTVVPATPAQDAARGMVAQRVGCAPVLDGEGRVCGIVTARDLLSGLIDYLDRHEAIAVRRIMTPDPVTARDDESLASTAEQMRRAGIRHLPVVDAHHHVIGVVSQRDLLAVRRSVLSAAPAYEDAADVAGVMREGVWSVSPACSAQSAARLLRDHAIGCLPVVEEGGRLRGILAASDLLSLAARLLDRSAEEKDPPARQPRVRDYMREPLVWVPPGFGLDPARELVDRCKISSLAVLSELGNLVGIVTRTDLLAAGVRGDGRTVGDVMTRRVHTVEPEEPIVRAAARLLSHAVHGLFVVECGAPIAALSAGELFPAARDLRLAAPLRRLMTPVLLSIDIREPIAVARRFLRQAGVTGVVVKDGRWPVGVFSQREALGVPESCLDAPVEAVMSRAILSLPPDLPLWRAAEQASALGARRILVVDGDRLAGIVTGTDVARTLGAERAAGDAQLDETKKLLAELSAAPIPS